MVETEYKDRLDEAMNTPQPPISVAALARALKVSDQAVYKALDGRTKSFSAANNVLAAELCGVNPSWLATGRGHKLAGQDHADNKGWPDASGKARVRVMLPLISGGSMQYIDRANDDPEVAALPTAEALLCEHAPTSKLYVSPSGIAGTRIRAGDMLEFGPADRPLTDDDVVALRDPDGLVVVRKHDPTYEKTHRLEPVALMVQFQGRSAV